MAYQMGSDGFFKTVNELPVKKKPLPSSTHYSGWTSQGPIGVMLHGTAGCTSDIYGILATRGISAHFNVDRAGNIYQYVSVRDRAAHAYDANHTFFGIEHTGQHSSCKGYTKAQRNASARLTAALVEWTARRWDTDIPLRHVKGCPLTPGFKEHRDGVNCYWNPSTHVDNPGTFWGWDTYLDLVRASVGATERRSFKVGTKTFNTLRRALRYLRRALRDGEVGEAETIRITQR